MKHFKILYNGFVLSIPVSVLCFQNEWLEMRVNVGHIGFAFMVLFYLSVLLYEKISGKIKAEKIFTSSTSMINLFACLTAIYLLIGTQRMMVLPAAILREALYLRKIPFGYINAGILTSLAIGIFSIMINDGNMRKPINANNINQRKSHEDTYQRRAYTADKN